jgi:TolB-like protein/class 3 adenylate cyclase
MERRLSAILAVDVVGYSRLMEIDEADTFERLRAHRKDLFEPEIAGHHGRIFKLTGDGLLAEFGSVVDAVECAVTLQRGMAERNNGLADGQRIDVRMGINLGDVIVEDEDRHGEGVVIAARLQQLAETGGICVSGTVADHVRNKLALRFESRGEERLKNIATPVAVFHVAADGTVGQSRIALTQRRLGMRWAGVTLAVVLLICGAALAAWYSYPRVIAPGGPPSIAVLPFNNMSNDPTLDYFGDGVAESIIGMLSRYPDVLVTARNTSFMYKGKSVDIRVVGKELNVGYVLEGSVQKGSDKVRIIAQLIDTASGKHVWSDRFDEEGSDPLLLQDRVTDKIVSALGGHKGKVQKAEYEQAWGKDFADLGEYDYYLRGHDYYFRWSKEDMARARAIFQEGLEKYPNSSLLRIKIGWTYYQDWWNGWSELGKEENLHRAFKLAKEALAEPNQTAMVQWNGYWLLADTLLYHKRDVDGALAAARAAKAAAPYDANTLNDLASILLYAGETDEAISWARESLRRAPQTWYHPTLAWAYNQKGDYEAALDEIARCDADCWPFGKHWTMMVSYYRLGRMDEARAAADSMRKERPDFTIAMARDEEYYKDPAKTERELEELRKMGFPEN